MLYMLIDIVDHPNARKAAERVTFEENSDASNDEDEKGKKCESKNIEGLMSKFSNKNSNLKQ